MGRTHLASCLLLLSAAAFAAATVTSQPARPSVLDTLRGAGIKAGGPGRVSAASLQSDEYGYKGGYHTEQKEICLMESQRTGCFGGPNIVAGDAVSQPAYWTSELTCCESHHERYSSSHGIGSVGSSLINPYNNMGACDWSISLASLEDPFGGGAEISPGITRRGSASATCYLGTDSDKCGGDVFCDRMVMSLEGSVYFVEKAYSHYGRSATYTDSTTEYDCADVIFGWGILDNTRMGQRTGNGTSRAGAQGSPGLKRQPAAAAPVGTASLFAEAETQNYGGSYHDDNRAVYQGRAVVINGVITAMSGPRKEKWDDGTFEHVVEFYNARDGGNTGTDTAPSFSLPTTVSGGALDPNVPWVQDKTYKFTFYKSGQYYK